MTFIYWCDNKFLLTPLEEMLLNKDTYGLVVVGRKRASIGYIKGKQIEIIENLSSGIPSKHGAGGQSQRRFERSIQEKETGFYRRLIKHMNQEYLRFKNLKAIFVGGADKSSKTKTHNISLWINLFHNPNIKHFSYKSSILGGTHTRYRSNEKR